MGEQKPPVSELLLERADVDRSAAESLRERDPSRFASLIAYFCQQAAEKSLKAAIAATGEDYPMTHDVDRLLTICERLAIAVAEDEVHRQATMLSSYESQARYTEAKDVTVADAILAAKYANAIADALESAGSKAVHIDLQDSDTPPSPDQS